MKEGIQLNQIDLITAITKEITRQFPKLPLIPRQFNAVIAAANSLVAEFEQGKILSAPNIGLEKWLHTDDTGSSSLFMAWILSSGQFWCWQGRKQPGFAYPRDPDDFGRCLRLVRAVPAFEEQIDLMVNHGGEWEVVAKNWHDWVEMYDANDERLYDVMQFAFKE